MKNKSKKNFIKAVFERPVLFHIIVWLLIVLVLSWLTSLNGNWPYTFYLLNMVVALPPMILFNYSMAWLSGKLMLKEKRYLVFSLSFITMTTFCAFLIPVMNHWFFFGIIYPRIFEPSPWFNWRHVPQNLIILWFPFLIFLLKTLFENWFKAEKEKLVIENKRLLAEIQLMKIKLHPHFLFNTLNNLYSMAKVNSESTPDYIMKLSEIYRIMLYECNKDFYTVNNELSLIRNYIELEKIRYDERLKLNVQIPECVDNNLLIPPLLLFTFVENSFKHGCRNDLKNPFIDISVTIDNEFLHFHSVNSLPRNNTQENKKGGIGLDNTRKRLELIYENEYLYEYSISENQYEVQLRIPNLQSL